MDQNDRMVENMRVLHTANAAWRLPGVPDNSCRNKGRVVRSLGLILMAYMRTFAGNRNTLRLSTVDGNKPFSAT